MYLLIAANILLAEGTEPVGVPGWIPVVIGVILLFLFWWGLSRNSIPKGSPAAPAEVKTEEVPSVTAVPTKAVTLPIDPPAVEFDDLKKIEGIGPKIEGILHSAGVRTFADLAAASVSQLEKIVREDAGIRVAYPDTWPEQSALAANNKWAELETLQDALKGGRRA